MPNPTSHIPNLSGTYYKAALPARKGKLFQLCPPQIKKLKETITQAILQLHRQPDVLQLQQIVPWSVIQVQGHLVSRGKSASISSTLSSVTRVTVVRRGQSSASISKWPERGERP